MMNETTDWKSDSLLKDLQGLGIAPKLRGWWMYIEAIDIKWYYIIWDTEIDNSIPLVARHFINSLITKGLMDPRYIQNSGTSITTYIELENFIYSMYSADLTTWEMTPEGFGYTDIRNTLFIPLSDPHDVYSLAVKGCEHFSNFSQVLRNYPKGTIKNINERNR